MKNKTTDDLVEVEFRAAIDPVSTSSSNYLNRLSTLRRSVFPGKDLRWIIMGSSKGLSDLSKIDANYAVIRSHYANVSTRKNFMTALLAVMRVSASLRSIRGFDAARARWLEFHDHMRAFQESKYKRHLPDEKQIEKYVGLDDIELKYQELKNKTPARSRQDSLDIVLLSLVLSMPPKRADLGSLRIYYDDDPRLSNANYMVINLRRVSSYIALNKYKTSSSYLRVDTDLPIEAIRDILDSLRQWPRDHLFENRFSKPFASNNAYGRYVQSVFKRLFGRATGVTMLRHIYITEKVDFEKMDDDELEDVAHQMMHSPVMQRKYNWNRSKICEALSRMCPECHAVK